MPSIPITSRTLIYERLEDGTLHLHDWNLVQTSLGAMVESRTMIRGIGGDQKDEELPESAYTDMRAITVAVLLSDYGFAGSQWPHYRANDPIGVL